MPLRKTRESPMCRDQSRSVSVGPIPPAEAASPARNSANVASRSYVLSSGLIPTHSKTLSNKAFAGPSFTRSA